jgi:hypothetical protein
MLYAISSATNLNPRSRSFNCIICVPYLWILSPFQPTLSMACWYVEIPCSIDYSVSHCRISEAGALELEMRRIKSFALVLTRSIMVMALEYGLVPHCVYNCLAASAANQLGEGGLLMLKHALTRGSDVFSIARLDGFSLTYTSQLSLLSCLRTNKQY